jgi:hypothetical protein
VAKVITRRVEPLMVVITIITIIIIIIIIMAQAVSHWPLNREVLVRAWVSPRRTCDGQSGNVTGFCLSHSVFRCQYHSTMALHIHILSWGMNDMSAGGQSSEI